MDAVEPIAGNPELRTRILELRTAHDIVIDTINPDQLLHAGGVIDTDRARSVVESWGTGASGVYQGRRTGSLVLRGWCGYVAASEVQCPVQG